MERALDHPAMRTPPRLPAWWLHGPLLHSRSLSWPPHLAPAGADDSPTVHRQEKLRGAILAGRANAARHHSPSPQPSGSAPSGEGTGADDGSDGGGAPASPARPLVGSPSLHSLDAASQPSPLRHSPCRRSSSASSFSPLPRSPDSRRGSDALFSAPARLSWCNGRPCALPCGRRPLRLAGHGARLRTPERRLRRAWRRAAASTTLGSAMGIPPHLPPALRRTSRRLARSRIVPTPCGARRSWRRRRAPRWRRAARATCAAAPSGSYAHRLRAAVDWRRTSHATVPAALRPIPFPGAVPAGVGELFGRVGALLLFGETRLGLEPRQPAQPRACACLRLQLKTSSSTRAAQ